jgi:hypothetical protein
MSRTCFFTEWKAECPKCHHIEISENDGAKCENCESPVKMSYAMANRQGYGNDSTSNSYWDNADATGSAFHPA